MGMLLRRHYEEAAKRVEEARIADAAHLAARIAEQKARLAQLQEQLAAEAAASEPEKAPEPATVVASDPSAEEWAKLEAETAPDPKRKRK